MTERRYLMKSIVKRLGPADKQVRDTRDPECVGADAHLAIVLLVDRFGRQRPNVSRVIRKKFS